MKFSIIIPTINRHLELQATLDTIYASSILPSEILIIDQSDNQETQKILIKNRYERIHYIKQDIKSSAIARNFAIDNLDNHSDLVFFLDDDISIDYHCFERVIKYMNINQNTK
jgi:glycosyltransferase involved in cell wall biosynthesis